MPLKTSTKELLEFNYAAYTTTINHMTNTELTYENIALSPAKGSSLIAASTGIGSAFFTHGVSLIGTGISFRRCHVAERKLEIVLAELARRDLKPHELTVRDHVAIYAIGLGPKVVTLGVSLGVADAVLAEGIGRCGFGNGASAALIHSAGGDSGASDDAAEASVPDSVGQAKMDFHLVGKGFGDGVVENVCAVEATLIDSDTASMETTDACCTITPTFNDAATALGREAGLAVALCVEQQVASSAYSFLVDKLSAVKEEKVTRRTRVTVTEIKEDKAATH